MKEAQKRSKHLLYLAGVLAVSGLLNACATSRGEPGTGSGPEPDVSFTALIDGPLDGPVYDLLKGQVRTEQNDGSQNPEDYDLIILDGNNYTADELTHNTLARKGFGTNTWLLILNATNEQKRESLLPSVGFATKGDTEAYMVRRQQDTPAIQPQYRILELSSAEATTNSARVGMVGGKDLGMQQSDSVEQVRRRGFVESAIGSLGDETIACELPQLEAGIIAASFCYTPSIASGSSLPTSTARITESDSTPGQEPSFVPNFGFTLLLSNVTDPTGDYQLLYATADIAADPSTADLPTGYAALFPNKPYFQGWLANADKKVMDNGWFQGQVDIEFDAGDTTTWKPLTYAPQNLNPKVSYTYSSGSGFSLGFDSNPFDLGGDDDDDVASAQLTPFDYLTYNYDTSTSKEYTVTDWTLAATNTGGSGADYQWQFYSQNPSSQDYSSNDWWSGGALPNTGAPNDLSTDLLSVGSSAVWQIPPDCTDPSDQSTCNAQTGTITFDGISATYYLTDLYCNIKLTENTVDIALACDIAGASDARGINTLTLPYSMTDIEFDLDALTPVTPVPGSLTFTSATGTTPSESPFNAGQCIKATFQLSGETPYPYSGVGVATQNGVTNAFVAETPVDIPQDTNEGTFYIGTNNNNMAKNGQLNIQASVKSVGVTVTSQFAIVNTEGSTEACPPSQ